VAIRIPHNNLRIPETEKNSMLGSNYIEMIFIIYRLMILQMIIRNTAEMD
jgi:hypothetical protein